ncbi:3-dehydroquinate synthase [Aestuariirhabdus litorea]|uniref:3-dehydroquinate synthase n=1 Tax=Aestuariirhabdus litorea TaxID=2528527 RepID=A0A3P3VND1_9GAMM|nr:3-dehydroquinate synthase [Aestuariirhabdus litorea]RRJ83156.1 3-dehydroquinate synthase [Aestuariirhabdus litorea]RWW93312.1 3-dehydroquinate synthase [Endozoicomonadaceae bacterium GTF-13]
MQTLKVELGERSYPIHIGQRLLEQPKLLTEHIAGRQVMVVTNDTVAPLYLQSLLACLEGYQVSTAVLPDGEQYKTLDSVSRVYDQLLKDRHNRTTTLIALGGGVIGDMTGFAAASYQRGVHFIQLPTTLLSQVDSSVGGKTGVNHPLGKNMIGAFHQPQVVLIDTDTLSTLPDRELSAGIAEVVKYGLLYDAEFYRWLDQSMDALMARDVTALERAIYRSCEIKAQIVARDERESGMRALLNLGHTFGHAIETHQGYGNWLHGEAVAVGMLMAADLSARLGWLSAADVAGIKSLLLRAGLPVYPPEDMSPEEFLALMAVDKKVTDGTIRLVLLNSIGSALMSSDFPMSALMATLKAGEDLGRF